MNDQIKTSNSTGTATVQKNDPLARGEQIRLKRETEKAEKKAKSIALQACLIPFLPLVVVIAASAVMNRPNLLLGLINLAIILYGCFCTVRTWINVTQKHKVLIQAIIGTLLNGALLVVVVWAFAVVFARPH